MKFKEQKYEDEIKKLKKRLQIILHDIDSFLDDRGHDLVITAVLSDIEEDKKLKRVSKSHSEFRAFDFRTKGIPVKVLKELEEYLEDRYKSWAAVSADTGLPNVIFYHGDGENIHAHVQVMNYKE